MDVKPVIMLACSAGMSTSILVSRMEEAAKKLNCDVTVLAIPTIEAIHRWQEASIILLGPQVRYELDRFKKTIKDQIPVFIIDQMDYGMGDGEKVLSFALQKLNL
ncbi:PTS system, cellobiose-specific IIB component [Spiroplasma sp. NBRC 100390]|uniref:PTS sugar transporter subunit IIB n=1 Tax=unclassified Spiroplasma TaxID=2637901 RepID=UPI00089295A3|nr:MULTISPECIES: PTS sugar transporter subunit IIB [unclassified Spiroplasma]AOX44027.1 PTS system, cellobiose-specific IIB component [Spiroplasma sp. TU-14]APE13497.1 PTS system, cellobiose-specific IIB component [Spiroplasma sp. NBRC 100390]